MPGHSFTRRSVVASALLAPFVIGARCSAAPITVFRPEEFGAKGDGRTNDTLAFIALSKAVQAAGGGIVELARRRVYLVGMQKPAAAEGGPAYQPADILMFHGLAGALRIEGQGAVLRAAPGLRYGAFEPQSGLVARRKMPNVDHRTIASPYVAMIRIEDCRGPVSVNGIELDGAIDRAVIGGEYGDTGRQVPMTGVHLRDNRGEETLSDIYSHHHGCDGVIIDGYSGQSDGARILSRMRCEYNGRQGCSIVGGHGYVFTDCRFAHTGKAAIASSPGAGMDIEAEGGKTISGLRFRNCSFVDNTGCGMVADSGPSRDVRFDDCDFVGTTNWSVWPSKPGFAFSRCKFVGSAVRPWGSENAGEATRFIDCQFTDRSPSASGRVYLSSDTGGPILDAGGSQSGGKNVLLQRCLVECAGKGLLPWSVAVTYQDCTMRQASSRPSYPRGTFRGTNRIVGNAFLDGSKFEGPTYLNGKRLA
jgi:hypothetical protein